MRSTGTVAHGAADRNSVSTESCDTGARTRDTHQKTARSASREALGVCIFFDRRFDTT